MKAAIDLDNVSWSEIRKGYVGKFNYSLYSGKINIEGNEISVIKCAARTSLLTYKTLYGFYKSQGDNISDSFVATFLEKLLYGGKIKKQQINLNSESGEYKILLHEVVENIFSFIFAKNDQELNVDLSPLF